MFAMLKKNADKVAIINALNYICGPANIDCSPINQGGDHYLPNDLISHANWAFNEYYQKNKKTGGAGACSFGGIAELVPPTSRRVGEKRTEYNILGLSEVYDFNIACPAIK